jgi:hypothetical protein
MLTATSYLLIARHQLFLSTLRLSLSHPDTEMPALRYALLPRACYSLFSIFPISLCSKYVTRPSACNPVHQMCGTCILSQSHSRAPFLVLELPGFVSPRPLSLGPDHPIVSTAITTAVKAAQLRNDELRLLVGSCFPVVQFFALRARHRIEHPTRPVLHDCQLSKAARSYFLILAVPHVVATSQGVF